MKISPSLLLVNRAHPLPTDYRPASLTIAQGQTVALAAVTRSALDQLLAAIGGTDKIQLVSGFRDYQEQQELYTTSLRENGPAYTKKYVALAGCSEHQTGLAVDVALAAAQREEMATEFPALGLSATFSRRAPEFGFILRYPLGKEDITGIAYEPWHYRYVGLPHSRIIAAYQWTLEEYLLHLGQASVFEFEQYRLSLIPTEALWPWLQQLPAGMEVLEISPTNQGQVLLVCCQVRQEALCHV